MSRPPVVLLHAFPLDARMWEGQREALAAAGWEVVAPDLPGPGPGPEPTRTLGAWADRVLTLVGGTFVPVGVSLGGYLAFELWRRAPERIPALVLVDTRATPETPEGRETRDGVIRLLGEGGVPALWRLNRPKLFSPRADPEAVERARAIAAEQPVPALVATVEAIRDREDSRETLRGISVPVLVVVGEDDEITPPSDAEAMAEALADARLVRIPESGHLPPVERPEKFNRALLAFLEEVAV